MRVNKIQENLHIDTSTRGRERRKPRCFCRASSFCRAVIPSVIRFLPLRFHLVLPGTVALYTLITIFPAHLVIYPCLLTYLLCFCFDLHGKSPMESMCSSQRAEEEGHTVDPRPWLSVCLPWFMDDSALCAYPARQAISCFGGELLQKNSFSLDHSYPKWFVSRNYSSCTSSDKTMIFRLALYCTIIDILKGLFLRLRQNSLNILELGHWVVGALWCLPVSYFKLFFLPINF